MRPRLTSVRSPASCCPHYCTGQHTNTRACCSEQAREEAQARALAAERIQAERAAREEAAHLAQQNAREHRQKEVRATPPARPRWPQPSLRRPQPLIGTRCPLSTFSSSYRPPSACSSSCIQPTTSSGQPQDASGRSTLTAMALPPAAQAGHHVHGRPA